MTAQRIHFIGIGGIGMSGIAQALLEQGHRVSGSDLNENANVQRLRKLGAEIFIGHEGGNIRDAEVVVVSTAVKTKNPEYEAAKRKGLPILHRSEMLVQLMENSAERICVGGTHGKTTVTTMMAGLFESAKKNPTVINGGIMNAYGANAKMGNHSCYVVEADESDGSFVRFSPTVSVVTNIDPEHMDHYKSFDKLMEAFETFVNNTSSEGCVILGIDHVHVQTLYEATKHPCVLTFGKAEKADLRVHNMRTDAQGSTFDVTLRGEPFLTDVRLKAFGEHNMMNAMAVIAVAHHYGWSEEVIRQALEGFEGVQRRFTPVGEWNGVTVIDDYAHHPVEISATLRAAKEASQGKLVAVLQPHRFSRLHHHFEDFAQSCEYADHVIILPVFPAGEDPIPGCDHVFLAQRMPGNVRVCEDLETLGKVLHELTNPGDMITCMGAGSISGIARKIPSDLATVSQEEKVYA